MARYGTTAEGKLILSPEIIVWAVTMGAWGTSTKDEALVVATRFAAIEHNDATAEERASAPGYAHVETEEDARRTADYELADALFDWLVQDTSLIAKTADEWAALGVPTDHPGDTIRCAPAYLANEIVAIHEGRHDQGLWAESFQAAQGQREGKDGLRDVQRTAMAFYIHARFTAAGRAG